MRSGTLLAVSSAAVLSQAAISTTDHQPFEHGKVYRVNRDERIEGETWKALGEYIELQMGEHVDIWNANPRFIDVQVPAKLAEIYEEFMKGFELEPELMVEDVAELVAKTKERKTDGFDYQQYNTLDDIYGWMQSIASEYDFVNLEIYGNTYEGRELQGLKISPSGGNAENVLFLNSGIHAREWVGPAHLMLATKMMLDAYTSGDQQMTSIFESVDLYIVPMSNPDGYWYTWNGDRMWRKTRSENGLRCLGVDPNRNWDAHWDQPNGASSNSCSDAFKGPSVWSEVEVRALRDYVDSVAGMYNGGVAFADLHAYSQLWMYPYGYQNGAPANGDLLNAISKGVIDAVFDTHGMVYQYGPIAETIYVASGSTVDYFLDTTGISCPFAAEMRDTGRYGFLLPADQIQPTAEEMYNGYMVLFQNLIAGNCPKLQ